MTVSVSNNSPDSEGVFLNVSKVCKALCAVGSLGSHEGLEVAEMVHMGVHDTLEGGAHFLQLYVVLGLCCSHFGLRLQGSEDVRVVLTISNTVNQLSNFNITLDCLNYDMILPIP